jgi:allantoinase
MSEFDLILRGGSVVTATGVLRADIGLSGEAITALAPELAGASREVINADGLHVFPGVIDAHVHFNEPGRAEWEGFKTGSRALAAGGGTLFFDMPLNAHPPTLDWESFRLKVAAAEQRSLIDFALWGGLVPTNVDRLAELAECGVIGFKAFMADSGIEDFACVEDRTLREGMKRAAQLRLPVAVHAESDTMTRQLAEERIAKGQTSVRDYLASRPFAAELDAIRRALDLAGETGCALHIVHVSCGEGIQLILDARSRGVNVSCETCPHYLVLTEDDVIKIGALAKCAPPLRPAREQEKLWQHLVAGDVTTVGSDHSPSPPEMKQGTNFFKVWGGISGGQHTLPLLLTEGHTNRGVVLPLIAALLSQNVAQRFKLPRNKGQITVGADADLALVDLRQALEVKASDLLYRHAQSPYVGRMLRGKVVRTILRGRTVFQDGKIVAKPSGRLVKPRN